jgi:predicted NBD/HSP70 family sugar kinase
MMEVGAPLPEDPRVSAIDPRVGIDANLTAVGIVARDDIGAAITEQGQTLGDRGGIPGSFEHHIGPPPPQCACGQRRGASPASSGRDRAWHRRPIRGANVRRASGAPIRST